MGPECKTNRIWSCNMNCKHIEGLEYYENVIAEEEELELCEFIDGCEWNTDLSRRTQQYGYRYPYFGRLGLTPCTDIPQWLRPLVFRMNELTASNFDQVIINEYTSGQGIRPHVDVPELFGPVVVSVSMSSDVIMQFSNGKEIVEVPLMQRSALVLKGSARYEWKHSIAARKKDRGLSRGRRISITFREVNQDAVVSTADLESANSGGKVDPKIRVAIPRQSK